MKTGIKTGLFIILLLAVLLINLGVSPKEGGMTAIYNGPGVWPESLKSIENILTEMGVPWKEISAEELNGGKDISQFKAVIFPGGWAPAFNEAVKPEGMENIRTMVKKGGVYIGFCAGAYFAAGTVVWEGINYPYPLGLFNGWMIGPIIVPWPEQKMTSVKTSDGNITMLYYGGPLFYPAVKQTVTILATWNEYWQSPAAVIGNYGKGKVVLFGPHPEVSSEPAKNWLKIILYKTIREGR